MTGSVVLIVGGERFSCNRRILQQASPYFDAMFNLDMKEKEAKEIEIHDIEPSIFTILMDFAYEKEVAINCENVIPLLRASSLFQFDVIQKQCCEYLVKHLNVKNCIKAWKLGEILGLQSLHSDAKMFILHEFSKLINEKDFLQLPLKLLIEILSHEALNCTNEMEVFDSVICWAMYNEINEIINLLMCIRFKSLSQEELEIIKNHELIHRNSESKTFLHLLTKWLMDIPTQANENGLLNIFNMKTVEEKVAFAASISPRKPLSSPLIIGKLTIPVEEDQLQLFCTSPYLLLYSKNKFTQLPWPFSINSEVASSNTHFYSKSGLCGCIACPVGHDLYIFGGEYKIGSGHWNRDLWKCNLRTSEWLKVGTMRNPRRHCLVTVLGETVYLIGGYGRFRERLTSVEIYDTKTGCWENQTPIPNPVQSAATVTFEGKIYVLSTPAYCYDPNEDRWTEMLPWKDLGFSSAFVFKNQIYAVTRQDPSVLLLFTLPNLTFKKEFVFPSNITCGCVVRNIFYGFSNNMVIAFNLLTYSCKVENLQHVLCTEMCCTVPNYDDV